MSSISARPASTSFRNAFLRSLVSVRESSGSRPRGRETTTSTRSRPRRSARESAGTAVWALRTKLTDDVARNSRREGSKASSQGLSATQSSIEVNTTSSAPRLRRERATS